MRDSCRVKWVVGAAIVLAGGFVAAAIYLRPQQETPATSQGPQTTVGSDERDESPVADESELIGMTGSVLRKYQPVPTDFGQEPRAAWCRDMAGAVIDFHTPAGEWLASTTTSRAYAVHEPDLTQGCAVDFAIEVPEAPLYEVSVQFEVVDTFSFTELQGRGFQLELVETRNPCGREVVCYH